MANFISADELVDVIYRQVFLSAVEGSESILQDPPGTDPGEVALKMKDWYSIS
jgi:hypothetical protein